MQGMDDMSSTSSGGMSMKMYFHGSIGSDTLWFASWVPTSAGATVGVCLGLFLLAIFERYLVAFRRACDASWRKGVVGYSRPTASGILTPRQPETSGNTTAVSHLSPSHDQGSVSLRRASSQSQKEDYLGSSNVIGSSSISSGAAPSYSYQGGSLGVEKDKGSRIQQQESPPPLLAQEPQLSYANGTGLDHLPKAARKNLDPARYDRWSRPFRWAVDLPRGLLQALQTLLHYLLMLVVMTFNIWWIMSVVIGSGVGEMLFGRFGASHSGQ
ncbi:hypothetical protein I316_02729 [Kwoniella heveanensis BCC8398]|uniref:Copper transport protein n=1 Tax=Kwoniella heveanensis BCC8398 TaxID=1296120 RepID=A0A1B9GXC1_9TREE|nr:hypothetical protein I316_02729 [Kwoniella heveanensis BCC8398]